MIIGAIFGFVACDDKDKDLSDIAVFITPTNSDTVYMNANTRRQYKLEYYSKDGFVNRLEVSAFDTENGERQLYDTVYSVKTEKDIYVYTAPMPKRDGRMMVTLKFKVWDTAGNETSQERKVHVLKSNIELLQEIGPIVLFIADDMRDALMFDSPTQTFDHVLMEDSKDADMYLDVDENGGLSLRSATQARFVRYNDFNYAETDANSLQTVYENSRRDDQINGLNSNDIILVGHGAQVEGVFFIFNIVSSGTDNERSVQMNFKGIRSNNTN